MDAVDAIDLSGCGEVDSFGDGSASGIDDASQAPQIVILVERFRGHGKAILFQEQPVFNDPFGAERRVCPGGDFGPFFPVSIRIALDGGGDSKGVGQGALGGQLAMTGIASRMFQACPTFLNDGCRALHIDEAEEPRALPPGAIGKFEVILIFGEEVLAGLDAGRRIVVEVEIDGLFG